MIPHHTVLLVVGPASSQASKLPGTVASEQGPVSSAMKNEK